MFQFESRIYSFSTGPSSSDKPKANKNNNNNNDLIIQSLNKQIINNSDTF